LQLESPRAEKVEDTLWFAHLEGTTAKPIEQIGPQNHSSGALASESFICGLAVRCYRQAAGHFHVLNLPLLTAQGAKGQGRTSLPLSRRINC